jgi:hypothetical protein
MGANANKRPQHRFLSSTFAMDRSNSPVYFGECKAKNGHPEQIVSLRKVAYSPAIEGFKKKFSEDNRSCCGSDHTRPRSELQCDNCDNAQKKKWKKRLDVTGVKCQL